MRVVSLIASATEILHALGLGAFQVGRSHECDHPPGVTKLPSCTRPRFAVTGSSAEIDRLVRESLQDAASVYEIDEALLASLEPTHILTQSHCRVCAVSRDDVERAMSSRFSTRPAVVSLEPNSLSDVFEDFRRVARACDVLDAGERLVAATQQRFDAVAHAVQDERPSVACIEWIEPLMSAGNWMPELVEIAGGRPLFTRAGEHSPYLEWIRIVEADPDVILVSPCGFDLERTIPEMHWLTSRPEWPLLSAVRNRRVYLADGNQLFNRPGPRLADSVELLNAMFRPAAHWCDSELARRWTPN
jgi:iron complex transport system substrate-binding protein